MLPSLWKLIPQNSSRAPSFWIANNSRGVNRIHFIWCAPTQDTSLSLRIRPLDCFGLKSIIRRWFSLRRFVAYVLPRSISVASRINRHEWAGVSNYNVFQEERHTEIHTVTGLRFQKKKMLSFAFTEKKVCSSCLTPIWPITFWFSSYTTRLWSGVSVFSDILELVPVTYKWSINKLKPLNTNLWCKLDRGFDSDGDISWPFVDFMNWDPVWIKAFNDSWKSKQWC